VRLNEIFGFADIPAVFQRAWSAKVSLRSPGGQNKESYGVAMYFVFEPFIQASNETYRDLRLFSASVRGFIF